jgi:hypothetical protein
MKTNIVLLVIAAGAILQISAAADLNNPAESAHPRPHAGSKIKPAAATAVPFTWKSTSIVKNDRIDQVGNLSSRSWSNTAGWNPGDLSSRTESSGVKLQGLPLLWMGQEPQR